MICSWLGLPPGSWPPDHYRLLSLELGEADAGLIEQRVHDRLDAVRCYQIMHPEQATEAMNRLAQAFVCLTEPSSKRTYDAQLGIVVRPVTAPAVEAPAAPPPQAEPLDWLPNALPSAPATSAPTPSLPSVALNYPTEAAVSPRQPPPLPLLALASEPTEATVIPAAIPLPPPLPSAPPLEPVDSVLESAQSGSARRGIATKRGIYKRIARTRRLIRLWNDLGKYLSSPKRRFNRSVEGPELIRLLDDIAQLLKGFPPLLGEAGQPGYHVLALTQVDTVKVFQSYSPHQRETLSRDWNSGLKLLTAHRDFLRQELRAMRRRPLRQRLLHAGWSLLVDQPGTVLLLLALLAINVALWRSYAQGLWEKLLAH
ncbi:MAG: hypothetical protein ACYC3I_08980 [Gemmataceae bacterium]